MRHVLMVHHSRFRHGWPQAVADLEVGEHGALEHCAQLVDLAQLPYEIDLDMLPSELRALLAAERGDAVTATALRQGRELGYLEAAPTGYRLTHAGRLAERKVKACEGPWEPYTHSVRGWMADLGGAILSVDERGHDGEGNPTFEWEVTITGGSSSASGDAPSLTEGKRRALCAMEGLLAGAAITTAAPTKARAAAEPDRFVALRWRPRGSEDRVGVITLDHGGAFRWLAMHVEPHRVLDAMMTGDFGDESAAECSQRCQAAVRIVLSQARRDSDGLMLIDTRQEGET